MKMSIGGEEIKGVASWGFGGHIKSPFIGSFTTSDSTKLKIGDSVRQYFNATQYHEGVVTDIVKSPDGSRKVCFKGEE